MANVKTAISIPAPLYAQAEELARELHISRSGLFVQALEAFLRRIENQRLMEQINRAYADDVTDHDEEVRRHAAQRQYRNLVEDTW
jgi:metal-responsive CopG/Arc/MetJ family transcriptional regulator